MKILKLTFATFFFVLLIFLFPSISHASSMCTSTWIGISAKQGWIVNGTDGQGVAYCTTRKPTAEESDELFQECNNDSDNRNVLVDWISQQEERSCSKLGMEVRESENGNRLAYPINNKDDDSSMPDISARNQESAPLTDSSDNLAKGETKNISSINFWSVISGLIGSILLFFFGLSPAISKDGHINLILEQTDKKEIKKYKYFKIFSYLGISLIALSFLLQLIRLI